jgi:hypothetical protein
MAPDIASSTKPSGLRWQDLGDITSEALFFLTPVPRPS